MSSSQTVKTHQYRTNDVARSAIHRHVKVLERAKLVQRKKSGRVNFLALNRSGLLLMQGWVLKYQAYWGTNEETLENYISSIEGYGNKLIKLKKKK